jgi:hypothetical protein
MDHQTSQETRDAALAWHVFRFGSSASTVCRAFLLMYVHVCTCMRVKKETSTWDQETTPESPSFSKPKNIITVVKKGFFFLFFSRDLNNDENV